MLKTDHTFHSKKGPTLSREKAQSFHAQILTNLGMKKGSKFKQIKNDIANFNSHALEVCTLTNKRFISIFLAFKQRNK